MSNKKVFKVADIHRLLKEVTTEKITYSRMVEIMNEMAKDHYSKAENLPISGVSVSLLEKAIDDTFNQVHYSFLHPEITNPIESNQWRQKWINENVK